MRGRSLVWLGSSREDLRAFPDAARRTAGFQLFRVHLGLDPDDWKPMPSVGLGVREIRIRTEAQHRVVYVTRFEEAIYVLHAFQKKSRKTARADVTLARSRYRLLIAGRSRPRR